MRRPTPATTTAWTGLGYRLLVAAFALFIAWWLFRHVVTLLLAALLAIILALPLAAVADRLERWKIPRTVSVAGQAIAVVALIAGFAVWLAPTLLAEVRSFLFSLPAILTEFRGWLRATFGLQPEIVGEPVRDYLLAFLERPSLIISAGTTGAQLLGGVLLVAIGAIYIAINPQPLVRGLLALVAPYEHDRVERVLGCVRARWLGWLRGLGVDMLATAVLTYIGLRVIGLEFAIAFAVLTGFLEVVPYLGPVIAAVPPVLYALTISPETALLTLAVFVAIQQIEGHLLLPLVMSQAVDLHPVIVAFGVVVLGSLFGLLGVLVAVPILSALSILVTEYRVKPLRERSPRAAVDGAARLDGVAAVPRVRP